MGVAKSLPDESVDLGAVNVVELLQGLLDLGLVGLDVANEDQGVVLLDLLHGRLGVQGVDDDLVLVHARLMGDRLAVVLGSTRQLQSLGAVEGGRQSDLALGLAVSLERCQYPVEEPWAHGTAELTPFKTALAAAEAFLLALGPVSMHQQSP